MRVYRLIIGLILISKIVLAGNLYILPQYGSNGQVGLMVGRYSIEHFNFYSTLMFNPQVFKEFTYNYELNEETGAPDEIHYSNSFQYYRNEEDDYFLVSNDIKSESTGNVYNEGSWKMSFGANYSFSDKFRINFGYGFQRNLHFEEYLRERSYSYSKTTWSTGLVKTGLDQETATFKDLAQSKSLSYLDIGFSFKIYKRLNGSYMFNLIEGDNPNNHNVGLGFRI